MTTKLTLTLDDNVIKKAKSYAKQHDTSVSKLVEAYFSYLTSEKSGEVSGIVAELAGVLEGVDVDALQGSYTEHLERKYR